MPRKSAGSDAPLTPVVFHILLALHDGPLHGYGVMQAVAESSEGKVKTGPGSIYGSIERMEEAGLVSEADGAEARRKYFKLTPTGRKALRNEAERIAGLADLVRVRHVL